MWAAALAAAVLVCAGSPGPGAGSGDLVAPRLDPVDVLVFAPHPDDEVIGAGGVIQQALAAGRRVRIVFATNGDGYPRAASALFRKDLMALRHDDYDRLGAARQREAVAADGALGLGPRSLVFLGYPDGVLADVYAGADGAPVKSPTTGRTSTYGPALTDFHTLSHGRPAPYTSAAALADVEQVLRESEPALVYVSDGADEHPDHRATYDLVRDAVAATGYTGELLTYLVHGGQEWPWPEGPTPGLPFEVHTTRGDGHPAGVAWPPSLRVPITAGENAVKLRAISAHLSQWEVDGPYLESFVKSEEIFWSVPATR